MEEHFEYSLSSKQVNISAVFSDAQVASGRRPRPSQALADWYAIATVCGPEPKALPEGRNSCCEARRWRTQMSTTSHQTVSQDQGHSLEGHGKISSRLTKGGHRQTDRKNKPCEPLGVTRVRKKTLPPPFSQSSSPQKFLCIFCG